MSQHMKTNMSMRTLLGASFALMCLIAGIGLWDRVSNLIARKPSPVGKRQFTNAGGRAVDLQHFLQANLSQTKTALKFGNKAIVAEEHAKSPSNDNQIAPSPESKNSVLDSVQGNGKSGPSAHSGQDETISQNVNNEMIARITTPPSPGAYFNFTGVYQGGDLRLELVGPVTFPSYISEQFRKAAALSPDSNIVIHLHARIGANSVANSAGPGGMWGHEEKLPNLLHGKEQTAVSFDILFGDKHLELFFNKERFALFEYRFNPAHINGFRFGCPNCIREGNVAARIPTTPRGCFAAYCTPEPAAGDRFRPAAASPPSGGGAGVGIQHAFYINLEHRKDRRAAIENELTRAKIPFERIEGVNARAQPDLLHGCFDNGACPGQVGCQMSHLKALKRAMDEGWDHVAIFEDDFAFQPWVDVAHVQTAVARAMELVPEWEVIALSLNIGSETLLQGFGVHFAPGTLTGLTWLHSAQTTGGYVARKSIIPKIHEAFLPENCLVKRDYHTAIDQCWKPLQMERIWLGFEPQPGTQARSFSDIEGTVVSYGLAR